MDKVGWTFKSLKTVLVLGSITFPILLTFTFIHQNSVLVFFNLVQGFHGTTTPNTSTAAAIQAAGEKYQNITITNSAGGPKNNSVEDGKNIPSLSTTTTTTIANDKLLDGLLVSSFYDEALCLSRYQSYLYRRASPRKPSQYLISKLRNYERLHRSCGLDTESYNKIMRKGAKFIKNDAGSRCKYLVWTASNGLGNRMLTLAASFLYAILTDRVLLVKFRADMFGLFCEPFPDSSWLLPRSFPYWKDQKHIETYENMLKNNNKANSSQELLPQFLILNLQHTHGYDGHTNLFHCDRSQDLLQKIPVLILLSDQYFVPSLFMIPSFRQSLRKMFPDIDTVFHHLGRYLFHPSNEAWELIRKYYNANLAEAKERIGLQIRVFNTHRVSHETIISEIIACTLQHKLLPELDMQKSATSPLTRPTSKVVLVASLYSEYGEKLRTMYQAKNTNVTRGEVIRVYQPSHEERQKSNNDMHNIKAWTEIYLLSLCDALVTSSKSTFGYVAHSLGGLKPWILQRAYWGETIPDPPCQRAKSMEPCFHYPPKYDCRANSTVDFTSIFDHMKHCEDVSHGLRLVNPQV